MKKILRSIWEGWKWFGRRLARINTEILLFLFYFLVFVPFGLILKLFRYDALRLRKSGNSNWEDAEIGEFDPEKSAHQS